jgi:hypothetical protein
MALVFTICATAVSVQGQSSPKQMLITFAAVDSIGKPDDVALVIRRESGEQRNLILLRAGSATIGDVALALGVLAQRQDDDSDVLSSPEERTTVKAGIFTTEDRGQILRFLDILNSLRNAPTRSVRGVGKVPAVDVHIALQRLKHASGEGGQGH